MAALEFGAERMHKAPRVMAAMAGGLSGDGLMNLSMSTSC
jgi:hypothetical protein